MSADCVSVIVPAWNAEATIDATLTSIRAQTWTALDIVVVDDGSTDGTRLIAARHAAGDPRVRVITQANAGVAAARNHGWANARGSLLAFVDADDLWAPGKIARQVNRLRASSLQVGLVYCWSAVIDAEGHVIADWERPTFEGDVWDALLRGNFVGNGSAALVTREAMAVAGGFEPALRKAGAQGCEDIVFYRRVARRFHFAVVAEHLVGYRNVDGAMSSNAVRMLESWLLAAADATEAGAPHDAVRRGVINYAAWLALRSAGQGSYGEALAIAARLTRHDRGSLLPMLRAMRRISIERRVHRRSVRSRPFLSATAA